MGLIATLDVGSGDTKLWLDCGLAAVVFCAVEALCGKMLVFCGNDVTAADAEVVVFSSGHVQYPCSEADVLSKTVVLSLAVDFISAAVVLAGEL